MKKIFQKPLIAFLLLATIIFSCSQKNKNILVIGDSNGAHEKGWVTQLMKIRPTDNIINYSIGGNTIGFDNLGRDTLNTLKNIDAYLKNALNEAGQLDYIIVALGTNDCKAVFDSAQQEVLTNLDSLINKIKSFDYASNHQPEVILVTPPPTLPDSLLITKYHGITKRLENLLPGYESVSKKNNCTFVDVHTPLKAGFDTLNLDGIHLNETGYVELAEIINLKIK